jgi:hypothetical protein
MNYICGESFKHRHSRRIYQKFPASFFETAHSISKRKSVNSNMHNSCFHWSLHLQYERHKSDIVIKFEALLQLFHVFLWYSFKVSMTSYGITYILLHHRHKVSFFALCLLIRQEECQFCGNLLHRSVDYIGVGYSLSNSSLPINSYLFIMISFLLSLPLRIYRMYHNSRAQLQERTPLVERRKQVYGNMRSGNA